MNVLPPPAILGGMLSVVQKVFQQHFAAYNRAQRQPLHVRKAATAIETCRTPARGYHIRACPNGHVNEPVNNSCHYRACALCALNTIWPDIIAW